MPHTKGATLKKVKGKMISKPVGEMTDVNEAVPLKSKKPLEIEEAEALIVGDDKPVDEAVLPEEEAEESADEIALDEEELNPFGDKWEQ